MRDIKFRAWDSYENKMYPVIQDEAINLMQYTGLKDRNGKEIYEGDILKIRLGTGFMTTVEVKFIDGCFDVCAIHGHIYTESRPNGKTLHRKRDHLKYYTANNAVEIIGNIYENPELVV